MQFFDLRRSNAVYIYRAIMDSPKTLREIATETEVAEITVKKIVYRLIEASILSRAKENNMSSVGRPKLYLAPNPANNCVLILKDDSNYIFYSVNAIGERSLLFNFSTNYGLLNESGSLQMAFLKLKQSDLYKHCHNVFFIDKGDEEIEMPEGIEKITPINLIIKSLIKEERTIYAEFGTEKVVINYGKSKIVSASLEEIEKIIDIDSKYFLNDLDEISVMCEALRIITLKELEEKVARLF